VLKLPLSETEILLPGSPPLKPQDLPSFIHDFGSYPAYYDMLVSQFSNVDKADWVLVNTFYELEQEVIKGLCLLISSFFFFFFFAFSFEKLNDIA
jgi:pathogen-inducible salicylic acid glucosyltransferase